MDETGFGTLDTFSGKVESLPILPNMGLLSTFLSQGGISTPDASPVQVDIKYRYGSELKDNSAFPLNDDLKYFDLRFQTGLLNLVPRQLYIEG